MCLLAMIIYKYLLVCSRSLRGEEIIDIANFCYLYERESSRLLPFVYRDMEKKYGQKRSSLKRNARVAGLLLLQNSGR